MVNRRRGRSKRKVANPKTLRDIAAASCTFKMFCKSLQNKIANPLTLMASLGNGHLEPIQNNCNHICVNPYSSTAPQSHDRQTQSTHNTNVETLSRPIKKERPDTMQIDKTQIKQENEEINIKTNSTIVSLAETIIKKEDTKLFKTELSCGETEDIDARIALISEKIAALSERMGIQNIHIGNEQPKVLENSNRQSPRNKPTLAENSNGQRPRSKNQNMNANNWCNGGVPAAKNTQYTPKNRGRNNYNGGAAWMPYNYWAMGPPPQRHYPTMGYHRFAHGQYYRPYPRAPNGYHRSNQNKNPRHKSVTKKPKSGPPFKQESQPTNKQAVNQGNIPTIKQENNPDIKQEKLPYIKQENIPTIKQEFPSAVKQEITLPVKQEFFLPNIKQEINIKQECSDFY